MHNMLVNPTGKKGKFRAVDWVVEGNNCEIKVIHGGQGSNQTIQQMITESALVGTYKAIGETMENNLHMYKTSTHGEPNMQRTFVELQKSLSDCSPHEFVPGRKSIYCIPDMLNKGAELLHNKLVDEEDGKLRLSLDDIVLEIL